MKILLDVDGVCAEFTSRFTAVARDLGLVEEAWDSSKQATWNFLFDAKPVWKEIDQRMNWWLGADPLINDVEIMLINQAIRKHDIYFVTSRQSTKGLTAEEQTRVWLESVGIDVYDASVIANKHKGALAKALEIRVALDDATQNLKDLQNHGVIAVARRWPYNEGWEESVDSVQEFAEKYF